VLNGMTIDSIHCAPCGIFNEAVIDVRSSADAAVTSVIDGSRDY